MPQPPAVIELSSLDGKNGFVLNGYSSPANLGRGAVASAGDVNGDGFDDFIVGARYDDIFDTNGNNGAAYVVFGSGSGFPAAVETTGIDGQNGFAIAGASSDEWAGGSVSGAGDVNGDGFDDVIVGAPSRGSEYGVAYVVFGGGDGFEALINGGNLDGDDGFTLIGADNGDFAGGSVSGGDVNGDGYSDLIVGANGAGPASEGSVYVVFGKAAGFADEIELSDLDGTDGFRITGIDPSDGAGRTVSCGDANGDGFDDVIIGAQSAYGAGYSGAAYVVFGTAGSFPASVDLADLDGANGFALLGSFGGAGHTVSSGGDVNGDGVEDVIVGTGGSDVYVVFGKASGFEAAIELADLDGTDGFAIQRSGGQFGSSPDSVSSAGDVNGDGFDDVIVGAWQESPNGSRSGASYVIFGMEDGFDATFDAATLDGNNGFRINGAAAEEYSGYSVSGAGDLNGDGFADLVIGAFGTDPEEGFNSGSAYVVFGMAPVKAVHRVGTVASQTLAGGRRDDKLEGLGGDDELHGNRGDDLLKGDVGSDTLNGGTGGDALKGGVGSDVHVYAGASDSTSTRHDTITGFDFAGEDRFDLGSLVTGVDAEIVSGALSAATFDADLAAAVDGAHLGKRHAVLFTPDSGDLAGEVFLVIDTNKVAGYQAGQDLVIHLANPVGTAELDLSDFI